ncbi:MAG TPA: flagellar basal body-associated FliL family protein [Pirellulales bacterium]
MSAATSAPASATADAAPAGQKSGWFWKFVVLGLMLAVIGAECLFAFVYVTSATRNAISSEAAPAKPAKEEAEHGPKPEKEQHGEHGKHGEHGEAADPSEEHELDIGEYQLTAFQAASNTTLLINFHLFGTVSGEDAAYFESSYEANKYRIRDQVLTTIRSAELADLTDPGLGLIKRLILEKTNRALGKPVLQAIVFGDFVAVEQ